jgi:hypothetical protein
VGGGTLLIAEVETMLHSVYKESKQKFPRDNEYFARSEECAKHLLPKRVMLPTKLLSVMACSELEVTVVAVSEIDLGRCLPGYGEGVTMTREI